MATYQRRLTRPPIDERERELWIQHAAGFIIFEDVRNYAIEQLQAGLTDDARAAALKAVDDAVYGIMMIIDGVSGFLENEKHRVNLAVSVQLSELDIWRPDSTSHWRFKRYQLKQGGSRSFLEWFFFTESHFGQHRGISTGYG